MTAREPRRVKLPEDVDEIRPGPGTLYDELDERADERSASREDCHLRFEAESQREEREDGARREQIALRCEPEPAQPFHEPHERRRMVALEGMGDGEVDAKVRDVGCRRGQGNEGSGREENIELEDGGATATGFGSLDGGALESSMNAAFVRWFFHDRRLPVGALFSIGVPLS